MTRLNAQMTDKAVEVRCETGLRRGAGSRISRHPNALADAKGLMLIGAQISTIQPFRGCGKIHT